MCNVWYCIKCGHQSGECCCQSDESACSGADAQQADKASAVSPRSSDGLLPLLAMANQLLDHCEGQKRYHVDRPELVEKWRNIQTGVRLMKDEIEIRMGN